MKTLKKIFEFPFWVAVATVILTTVGYILGFGFDYVFNGNIDAMVERIQYIPRVATGLFLTISIIGVVPYIEQKCK